MLTITKGWVQVWTSFCAECFYANLTEGYAELKEVVFYAETMWTPQDLLVFLQITFQLKTVKATLSNLEKRSFRNKHKHTIFCLPQSLFSIVMNETTETQRSAHGNSLIITAASFVNYWYFHLFWLQKLHKQKKNLERKKALHRFLKPSVTSVSLWFWLIHRPKLKDKMFTVTKDTRLSSTWFIFDRYSFTPDLLDCVRYIHVGLHGAVGDKNQRWTNDIFSRVTLFL